MTPSRRASLACELLDIIDQELVDIGMQDGRLALRGARRLSPDILGLIQVHRASLAIIWIAEQTVRDLVSGEQP